MSENILLISSGQPSANPRLVKEATALQDAGYQVRVIYCPLSPWADTYDQELFKRYPNIQWIRVGFHPQKNKIGYLYTRIRRKCYELLYRFLFKHPLFAERALVLYSQELKKAALSLKAALYIGHNLGALPAVIAAARKHKAKAVFDFEDYHRGEHPSGSLAAGWVQSVEDHYVPHLTYATAAAPLIAQAYEQTFPNLAIHTINNCFPKAYAPPQLPQLPHRPLRLFWFSQYVGKQRGLEQVVAAMGKLQTNEIVLTLLGACTHEMRDWLLEEARKHGVNATQVQFLPPVAEPDIVKIAAEHHIGLAVEVPHIPNREVCLTNKIFMYLLAGNAIVFSNTPAQQQFLQQHPGIGTLFNHDAVDRLAALLSAYLTDASLLNSQRSAAYALGQQLNWEVEKQQFLALVKAHG